MQTAVDTRIHFYSRFGPGIELRQARSGVVQSGLRTTIQVGNIEIRSRNRARKFLILLSRIAAQAKRTKSWPNNHDLPYL